MSSIPDEELQEIRDDVNEFLDKTCNILGDVQTPNDSGGYDSDWGTVKTVPCMLMDASVPQEFLQANQIVGRIIKKVLFPYGTSITKANQLSIDGIVYKVVDETGLSSDQIFDSAIIVQTTLVS